jgi:hypothetical protein
MKLASQFKALAEHADFNAAPTPKPISPVAADPIEPPPTPPLHLSEPNKIGLVYRFEIHLPDTTNVETFRAIFRAMREELNL